MSSQRRGSFGYSRNSNYYYPKEHNDYNNHINNNHRPHHNFYSSSSSYSPTTRYYDPPPNNALYIRVTGTNNNQQPGQTDLFTVFESYGVKECCISRRRFETKTNCWTVEFRACFSTLTEAKLVKSEFHEKTSHFGGKWTVIFCRSSCEVLVDGLNQKNSESLQGKSVEEQETFVKATLRMYFPKAFHVRAEPEKGRGFVTFNSIKEANEAVRDFQDFEVNQHKHLVDWTFRLSFHEVCFNYFYSRCVKLREILNSGE